MWAKVLALLCIAIIIHLYLQDVKQMRDFDNRYIDKLYNRFKHRFEKSATGVRPDAVDMIYCIRSEKRKEYVTKEINTFGLKVTYFDAIFPKDLTKEDYDTLVRKFINPLAIDKFFFIKNKKTATPIQISFLMCFLHAFEHGYDTVMILEDDIQIDTDYHAFVNAIDEFVKTDYSLLYLGYCMMSCNQDRTNINDHEEIMKINKKRLSCSQAIVYKTDFLKDYVYNLFPIEYHCDYSINKYCIDNNKDICITKTPMIRQNKELESMNGTPDIGLMSNMCDFT